MVGPTEGAINTNGTQGDDATAAPIGPYGTVQGLGGDDTICLVNGLQSSVLDQSVSVQPRRGQRLGRQRGSRVPWDPDRRARHRGRPLRRRRLHRGRLRCLVVGATPRHRAGRHRDPRGRRLGLLRVAGIVDGGHHRDAPGRDSVTYAAAAGGTLDNGPDPDNLRFTDKWEGDLAVDNVTRRATVGDGTVLTWTSVDTFSMRASRRGRISFVGSGAPESINIVNMGQDLAAPSQITTGGGDDSVGLAGLSARQRRSRRRRRLALVRGLSPGVRRARRLGGVPHHRRASRSPRLSPASSRSTAEPRTVSPCGEPSEPTG